MGVKYVMYGSKKKYKIRAGVADLVDQIVVMGTLLGWEIVEKNDGYGVNYILKREKMNISFGASKYETSSAEWQNDKFETVRKLSGGKNKSIEYPLREVLKWL